MKKTYNMWPRLIAMSIASGMLCSICAGAESALPNLSSYPTTILVDGIPVTEGPMSYYQDEEILLPLRTVLEHSGFTVT